MGEALTFLSVLGLERSEQARGKGASSVSTAGSELEKNMRGDVPIEGLVTHHAGVHLLLDLFCARARSRRGGVSACVRATGGVVPAVARGPA